MQTYPVPILQAREKKPFVNTFSVLSDEVARQIHELKEYTDDINAY
jgi:hypothetical protein